jgi:hypothetical protein
LIGLSGNACANAAGAIASRSAASMFLFFMISS